MKKLAIVAAAALLLSGCANSPKGMRVVVSSSSTINLGDINWDEYKIPVFSIYSGPRMTLWVNKNYLAPERLQAWGSVTNDVAALGIYASKENKNVGVDISFRPVVTNGVTELEAVAPSPRESETAAEQPPAD